MTFLSSSFKSLRHKNSENIDTCSITSTTKAVNNNKLSLIEVCRLLFVCVVV